MESIKIAGRKFKWTEGQEEVRRSGAWILYKSRISDCGRYQNYKLYRDIKASPKKVFYLGYDMQEGRLCYVHDFIVLREHYVGMDDWILRTINGDIVRAPEFDPWNEIGERHKRHEGVMLPPKDVDRIVSILEYRWKEGRPLSVFPQTRRYNRYAPDFFAKAFKLDPMDVEETIGILLSRGVLSIEVSDKTAKRKGLKVIGEASNG
jgi:hypothetical protein